MFFQRFSAIFLFHKIFLEPSLRHPLLFYCSSEQVQHVVYMLKTCLHYGVICCDIELGVTLLCSLEEPRYVYLPCLSPDLQHASSSLNSFPQYPVKIVASLLF